MTTYSGAFCPYSHSMNSTMCVCIAFRPWIFVTSSHSLSSHFPPFPTAIHSGRRLMAVLPVDFCPTSPLPSMNASRSTSFLIARQLLHPHRLALLQRILFVNKHALVLLSLTQLLECLILISPFLCLTHLQFL